MWKVFGFVSLLIATAIIGFWAVKYLTKNKELESAPSATEAIAKAKALYLQQKSAGTNFSNGPCLSNNLLPGWVADIAHKPRQAVDDLPENQCEAFLKGKARHFVELDIEGNLIRAQ